jgi:hypothetical protein
MTEQQGSMGRLTISPKDDIERRYLAPEEFEQVSHARGSDGADGSAGKPKNGLPPLPQALEILTGLPHFRDTAAGSP